jgi:hypothetical protein
MISNFRRVLNVVFFLLGDPPGSEFYVPTFRSTLSGRDRKGPSPSPIGPIFKGQTVQVDFLNCLTLFLDCWAQALDHVVTAIGSSIIHVSKYGGQHLFHPQEYNHVVTCAITTSTWVSGGWRDNAPPQIEISEYETVYFFYFNSLFVCLFLAQQSPAGHGLLIHDVSKSHTTTHCSR